VGMASGSDVERLAPSWGTGAAAERRIPVILVACNRCSTVRAYAIPKDGFDDGIRCPAPVIGNAFINCGGMGGRLYSLHIMGDIEVPAEFTSTSSDVRPTTEA
jgi:hypothetical protein